MSAPPPRQGPPPPIIPTSWLQPHEQRFLFISAFGLLEAIKIWDILAPYFIPSPEPTWSSPFRPHSLSTAALWLGIEITIFSLVSVLRIPQLSPSTPRLAQLAIAATLYNAVCWFVAEPASFWVSLNLFGPPALGVQWYLSWWPLMKGLVWKNEGHISGVHKIRLLPFSTATLNPLSLTYCLPPDSSTPIYIPVVFNNSIPSEVSYYIRSLDNGHKQLKTISGLSMKRSSLISHKPRLAITDNDEDDVDSQPSAPDPLSAIVLRNHDNSQVHEQQLAKLPSIRPDDSLSVVPKDLTASENMLFITVDKPSIITLKTVSDKRGDRFHVAPHREAVIIECPLGGDFVSHSESEGRMVKKGDKRQPAEIRCVGDEEVVKFQVRGVGTLRAGWKKKSKDGQEYGVVEGIEDEAVLAVTEGEEGMIRRDKVAKTHTVPLRIKHDTPGVYTISLTSITDSHHNTQTASGHSAEKVFQVISKPWAQFECPPVVQILKDKTVSLPLTADAEGGLPSDVELTYEYKLADGQTGTKKLKVGKKQESILVSEPGTYRLLDIAGQCPGSILEPATVTVVLVPPPSVEMGVTTLHECSMDVGVTAAFDFTGTPPFTIEYTEQRRGARVISRKQRFESLHGEIVLLPEQEGSYTYSFNTLSDKHYVRQQLDKPPIEQTVHPLASVEITSPKRQKLYACSGDSIDLQIEAKGRAPLRVTYLLTSTFSKSENVTVEVPSGRSHINVPVPSGLNANSGNSGKFSVGLIGLEDGNGCARRLAAPGLEVEVDRVKPTGRFAKGGAGRVVVVEGEVARAGMRLTGTGPWTVVYGRDGGEEKRVTVRDPNSQLSLDQKGVYRLLRVNDAHCPGSILDSDSTFEVAFQPRPEVHIQPGVSLVQNGKDFKHKGLCAEEEDQVAFKFKGQAPFELVYRHTREGSTSRHTLKSAQDIGILHLDPEPGTHRYDFTELRDSNYHSTPISLSLSHEIHTRPSVSFLRSHTGPLCLDSPLKADLKIRFQGKAPFKLGLSIRKPASSLVKKYEVEVKGKEWVLDLPEHIMDVVGRHEVLITELRDQSGCDWAIGDEDTLGAVVEVVESARIVAVNQVEDLCVGDTLDFLLQGKAPWTIEYEWSGKKHKVTSSASRFSRYAEEKGKFAVTSVALKDNQCKREISNLVRTIHPLPSVKIQEGVNHLREGDEPAVFSVHFTGSPPFSFTYTRSEVLKLGGKPKVVETQTITDIPDDEYTISSSLPGDYEVVAVSDRYCRYPPLKARDDK